ncbi:MAG: T9SS type A sorting domain-containing protein, partial [Ignavibacteria bacterium]
ASLVYFQDRTDGMVAFDAPFGAGVKRGDSIEVTGTVVQFNGLTELQPVSSFTILDSHRTVNPVVVTCGQIRTNGEPYEGMLIKILNVTAVHNFSGANVTVWTVAGSGSNYRLISGGDSCDIRIYGSTNVANRPVPPFPFNVVALTSQFKSSPPFNSGYQIIPRDSADFSLLTGIVPYSSTVPGKYILNQNYPNPFNPKTIISYELPENNFVLLKIYNVLGEEAATLVSKKQNAGNYSVEFDGDNFSSGIYFYSLFIGNNAVDTKKMFLLK